MADDHPGDGFVGSYVGPDRNLGLCALGVVALTGWNVWGRLHSGQWARHPFAITAEVSFAAVMIGLAALFLWSALCIRRYLGERRPFWIALERRHRGRVFAWVYGLALALPVTCVAFWAVGARLAVAALLWPTGLAVFAAVGQLTRQIRPLITSD